MKLGFIIPNYPNEKRVALLPEHIKNFNYEIIIEQGFGSRLGINDSEYIKKGCKVLSRKEVFKQCKAIFSIKLIQECDYDYLREGQIIFGWTHPNVTGKEFVESQVIPKKLVIIDLDNIRPQVFYNRKNYDIDFIPRNFIYKNSINAGYSSTIHATMSYGLMLTKECNIAILASGNVSQGAFIACSKLGGYPRMFYRKTMNEFYKHINEFDVIISGIEVNKPNIHILSKSDIEKTKKNVLLIDAAADAGNAIEGTDYTSYEKPLNKVFDRTYYCVNNSPSIFYRNASFDISLAFSKYVYTIELKKFTDLIIQN